tara:strand:+ start:114 stop:359 length:246 start_codon:yes stop_codon:yes gene_type:complete
MKLININTTAYKEEDFLIYTDLTKKQIIAVIEPFVLAERQDLLDSEDTYYDNQILVNALKERYPKNHVDHYQLDDIDQISI